MDSEQKTRLTMKAADRLAPHFDGVAVIGSFTDADGDTCRASAIRGNRHAVIAAVEEWIRNAKAYDDGYQHEKGRYDAVVARQKRQERE